MAILDAVSSLLQQGCSPKVWDYSYARRGCAMTLSIVAKCANSGQVGVAAVTAMPAVGKLLTHAAPNVGAVATQARINPYLGLDGLRLLRQHISSMDVCSMLQRSDPLIQKRQLAVVDMTGRAVAFTGEECPAWAGHIESAGFAVQGNRLVSEQVAKAAAEAMERSQQLPLAERLLAGLEAADRMGGDAKDELSATLYVMDTEEYPLWDVRVDYHESPVAELRRLFSMFKEQLLPQILAMPTRRNPAGDAAEESV